MPSHRTLAAKAQRRTARRLFEGLQAEGYRGAHDKVERFVQRWKAAIPATYSTLIDTHHGISQDKLPLYLGFFQFMHHGRRRGKVLIGASVAALTA